MEYPLIVPVAIYGDVFPLFHVVESMSRHVASGFGRSPTGLHGPTLDVVRPKQNARVWAAVIDGKLIVQDSHGIVLQIERLSQISEVWKTDYDSIVGQKYLGGIFVSLHDLNQWAASKGDVFTVVEAQVTEVFFDLTDANGAVLEEDYYKGFVSTGEVQATPLPPEQEAAPVVQGNETKEQRQDRRLKACEDAGLCFKDYKGRLPDGVGDVADREGVTRQALSTDVKAALIRKASVQRDGVTVHRT